MENILIWVVLGPVGVLLTFAEYGLSFDAANQTVIIQYLASAIGTTFWAIIISAVGDLVS